MTPEEIDAEIARLKELKKKPRGRPALSRDELLARELQRLEIKEEAKRIAAERRATAATKRPNRRGKWQCTDGRCIVVSDQMTYIELIDGKLSGPARKVDSLTGEWLLIGEWSDPDGARRETAARAANEAAKRAELTKRWKERRDELGERGAKPCANFECGNELDFSDVQRFCPECLAELFGESA